MEIESRQMADPAESTSRAVVRGEARETLSDSSGSSSEPVKETVLEALYRHHPEVDLEDILELNVLIPAPEDASPIDQIDAVLTSVSERADAPSFKEPKPTPEAEKAAVGHHGTR